MLSPMRRSICPWEGPPPGGFATASKLQSPCVSRVQEPATVARAAVECRAANFDANSPFSEAIRRGAEKPGTQSRSHQANAGATS